VCQYANKPSNFNDGGESTEVRSVCLYGAWCMVYGVWCMVHGGKEEGLRIGDTCVCVCLAEFIHDIDAWPSPRPLKIGQTSAARQHTHYE